MLRKYRALIITVSAVVIAVAVIIGVGIHHFNIFHLADEHEPVPALSAEEKEKVEEAFLKDFSGTGDNPIIWYEENGFKEEKNVWRYVGKYGDCYAFIATEVGFFSIDDLEPVTSPKEYPIRYLTREVMYPQIAQVYLYHTQKEVTFKETNYQYEARLAPLGTIKGNTLGGGLHEWLTDAQLEELTQDIEKIAKEHE